MPEERNNSKSSQNGQAQGHGYLMLLVGDERGTSDAALGIAMRGAGHNLRVHIIEFLKAGRERGEVSSVSMLTGVTLSQYGLIRAEQTAKDVDGPPISPDRLEAALRDASNHVAHRVTNILILDGLLTTIADGLVSESKVLELVDRAASWLDIVVTGTSAPEELKSAADSITVIETTKSSNDVSGVLRRGIHY